ncbi:ATP-binding protein (plasmid) [Streptomyces sp. BI20]|uniref:ATP-binding protein n=1 Tax=Streptomyces sp. BI20 TaxID=3403460 RepID=UPI003C7246AA
MEHVDEGDVRGALFDGAPALSVAFEGGEDIARARDLARGFLREVRAERGATVSEEVVDTVELVVSELVTNARKYAPGPYLLSLELGDRAVEVTVWDSEPALPTLVEADPLRVGRHGLEIIRAVCRSLEMRRVPVGKRIRAVVASFDAPDGTDGTEDRTRTTAG